MTQTDWKRTVPLPSAVRLAWHEAEAFPRNLSIAELYADLRFPAGTAAVPYLVANMVMTQNGEATVRGKATTIGTAVDGLVLTRLRTVVDAVLVGSGTLVHDDVTAVLPEAEVTRRIAAGRSPRLLVAIVASSLSWDQQIFARQFFADARFDKVVLTGRAVARDQVRAVEKRGVGVVPVAASEGQARPSVLAVLEVLGARGIRSIVCEGGPRFLPSLFAAQTVREYFLTTSPMLTGDPGVPRPVFGSIARADTGVRLSRVSRYEHDFHDPLTGARLVEAFDRFRVIYPASS